MGGRHLGLNRFMEPIWLALQKLMKLGKKYSQRGFPGGSVVKNPPKRQEMPLDAGSISQSERPRRRA